MPRGHANSPEAEAERRRKIGISSSQRQAGQSKPESTKRKIAETLSGRTLPESHRAAIHAGLRRSSKKTAASVAAVWEQKRQETGQPLGYFGAHNRVRKLRGPAKEQSCSCGRRAQHWAHLHGTDPTEPMNYQAMCQRCHFAYDDVRGQQVTTMTADERREAAERMWRRRSPEQRAEITAKASSTRRRNRELAMGTSPEWPGSPSPHT